MIRVPDPEILPVPDPGVKKGHDPESRFATLGSWTRIHKSESRIRGSGSERNIYGSTTLYQLVSYFLSALPEDAESLPLLVPAAGAGAAQLRGGAEDLKVQEGGLVHPQNLLQLG
jgi:hypothetical protein